MSTHYFNTDIQTLPKEARRTQTLREAREDKIPFVKAKAV